MSRISNSVKNVKVSMLFYMLILVLSFFSRRVFIDALGTEFVGLSATVINYIGFMNLAELGITAAIANVLYGPLFRRDREQITELVSLMGWLFRIVGIIIGTVGLTFALFIPWIFADAIGEGLDVGVIYMAYFSFLTTTMLSYLVNYKRSLLVADQRDYVLTRVMNLSLMAKIVLQMALLQWAGAGYVTWLALEVIFGVVFSVWLEMALRREYPWLRSSPVLGRTMVKKYKEVFRGARRVFSHKIAMLVLVGSDVVVIQLLMSLSMVTFYTNYSLIMSKVVSFITGSLQSSYAGVGNLVAEGEHTKVKMVFCQFNAMYFWIAGVLSFAFYTLVNPFIVLWLKQGDYVLFPEWVVAMLVGTLFIGVVRQTVQYFLNAYALYHDVWAPWTEAGLNIIISVWACSQYGVAGVVAGTLVSTGLFAMIWKPYFLYKRGFREPSREYWVTILKYLTLLGLSWIIVVWIVGLGWLPAMDSWWGWIINAVMVPLLYGAVSGCMMYFASQGMRQLVKLWTDLMKGVFKRLTQKITKIIAGRGQSEN